MAGSLIRGLCAKGHDPRAILAYGIRRAPLDALAANCGIVTVVDDGTDGANSPLGPARAGDPPGLMQTAEVLVLAVKPQVMETVCRSLSPLLAANSESQPPPLLMSVAAGVPIARIEHWVAEGPLCGGMGNPAQNTDKKLGQDAALGLPIVRCMPNTPALVGLGASGMFANGHVSQQQRDIAQAMLDTVGLCLWLEQEAQLDAVTALSGSGPAYFFLFLEAMQEAAVELGLDASTAHVLSCQTAAGAAALAAGPGLGEEAADEVGNEDGLAQLRSLRQQVTSPGGTTEAAIKQFMHGGLKSLVAKAMQAAHARSVSLANMQRA